MIKTAARLISYALLGKSGKQPLDIAKVRKVLILRNDKIGDMIVTSALLRELKKTIRTGRSTWPPAAPTAMPSPATRM